MISHIYNTLLFLFGRVGKLSTWATWSFGECVPEVAPRVYQLSTYVPYRHELVGT